VHYLIIRKKFLQIIPAKSTYIQKQSVILIAFFNLLTKVMISVDHKQKFLEVINHLINSEMLRGYNS